MWLGGVFNSLQCLPPSALFCSSSNMMKSTLEASVVNNHRIDCGFNALFHAFLVTSLVTVLVGIIDTIQTLLHRLVEVGHR